MIFMVSDIKMGKVHPTKNQESNAEKATINEGNHYQKFVRSSPKE